MIDINNLDTRFESYFETLENENLFDKTLRLDKTLSGGILTGVEALGLTTENKTSPISYLTDKNGEKRKVIMLGSNSYLNLSSNKKVIKSAKAALKKFGLATGAVSNYAGITQLHIELEHKIAKLYNTEDAIIYPSGYGANMGIISALCSKNDVIICDSANHASIMDGARLSGAEIKIYPHKNMKYLEKILSEIPENKKGRLIITDGVFSMDGDMAPLDKIYELSKKYGCAIMTDDANGIGITGKTGKGTAEYFNLSGKIDLNAGMLSKTPGGLGGYCAAKREIIQFLRLYSRTYFFSTSLPPAIVAGLNTSLELILKDEAGRSELMEKVSYFKDLLIASGFDIGNSQSAIIPLMVYDEEKLFKMHKFLLNSGIYTNIVTYPAVRRKECRLRLCVMKDLRYSDIEKAVKIITKAGIKFGLTDG